MELGRCIEILIPIEMLLEMKDILWKTLVACYVEKH